MTSTTLSSQFFLTAFEQSREPTLILEAHQSTLLICHGNPALAALTGYDIHTLQGKSLAFLCVDAYLISNVWQGNSLTAPLKKRNGELSNVEWNLSPVHDTHGQLTYQIATLREQHTPLAPSTERVHLLQMALEATNTGVLITDEDGNILFANHAFESQTGYHANEIIGKTPTALRSGPHGLDFYQSLWRNLEHGEGFSAVFTNRHRDGSLLHIEQTVTPVRNDAGDATHFISISRDMTQYVAREKALQALAFHDRLTGLNNRSFGEQQLTKAWRQAVRYKRPLSVIMADIDHFKRINDTYGHASGDRILTHFGAALRRSVRGADTLIRWGGEEFLAIIPEADLQTASKLAERVRSNVEEMTDDEVGKITVSLGVAQLKPEETPDQLVRRADQALYAAKAGGRNRVELAQ